MSSHEGRVDRRREGPAVGLASEVAIVEAQIDATMEFVAPLAAGWSKTLLAMRSTGWGLGSAPAETEWSEVNLFRPPLAGPDTECVDLEMLAAYHRVFDKLADLAEQCDPFTARSATAPSQSRGPHT